MNVIRAVFALLLGALAACLVCVLYAMAWAYMGLQRVQDDRMTSGDWLLIAILLPVCLVVAFRGLA